MTGRPLRPTREETRTLQEERKILYTKDKNLPEMFLIIPTNFQVDDLVPLDKEIHMALSRLKNGKSPGASGLTVDQLKMWMQICKKKPEP